MGGSCAVGYVLHQYLVGSKTPTPGPATEVPTQKVVYKVVTNTPGPATEPPTQRVIIITATCKPEDSTKVMSPTPTATPTVALFVDNFETGLKPEWQIIEGDWRMVNGKLSTLSKQGWSSMLVGDVTWDSYTVEATFDTTNNGGYPVGVIARAQDAGNMVYFHVAMDAHIDQPTRLVLKQDRKEKVLVTGPGVEPEGKLSVKVEAQGDLYTAYINGERWLSASDTTFSRGRAGLGLYCWTNDNCNTVSGFKVTPLQ